MVDFFQSAGSGFREAFYPVFNVLWGDFITIPLPGGGQLGISLMVTEKKTSGKYGTISGVQALIVSTATRVGMGNLVGVVAAISAGGAGAVFWMWLIALLGSSTAFVEATLAQL